MQLKLTEPLKAPYNQVYVHYLKNDTKTRLSLNNVLLQIRTPHRQEKKLTKEGTKKDKEREKTCGQTCALGM